ncbi:hypothetical protein BGX38DRAFT_1144147 [Terfezia claveryi]|nr:hypothetical protein BGX38DRAFT_1144147 [Terfezia claveryi]
MPASGALKRQGWTEEERKEIYDYASAYPDLTWRGIKRWFEDKFPNKILTQSQISKILNPTKRPRGPSDASTLDPQQVQQSRRDRKRLRTGQYPLYYRERRRIEAAQLAVKRKSKQTVITAFFTSSGPVPGRPVPSSSPTSR